jgi:hypothetical protein
MVNFKNLYRSILALIFSGHNAQTFQIMQIFSQLQKPVCTKLSVCKIINLKLYFLNIVILVATKIVFACFSNTVFASFNKTGE